MSAFPWVAKNNFFPISFVLNHKRFFVARRREKCLRFWSVRRFFSGHKKERKWQKGEREWVSWRFYFPLSTICRCKFEYATKCIPVVGPRLGLPKVIDFLRSLSRPATRTHKLSVGCIFFFWNTNPLTKAFDVLITFNFRCSLFGVRNLTQFECCGFQYCFQLGRFVIAQKLFLFLAVA